MAGLSTPIIRIVAEELNVNTQQLADDLSVCTLEQQDWVFGDEEVLPSAAEVQEALLHYEALAPLPLSIADAVAAVKAYLPT